MRVLETKVYTFDELSDDAKEKAREWYRSWAFEDNFWSENVIENAKEIAKILGIQIDDIYWSGFWSQGDGACFVGRYSYAKGAIKAIKALAPQDETLHAIARNFQEAQRPNFYRLSAVITHNGQYYHSHSMTIRVDVDDYANVSDESENAVKDALRDFADWIYRQLEAEYEYQDADARVDESIVVNEYEFDEYGNCA